MEIFRQKKPCKSGVHGFDAINHIILLSRFEAYGFSLFALKTLQSYLCNRN